MAIIQEVSEGGRLSLGERVAGTMDGACEWHIGVLLVGVCTGGVVMLVVMLRELWLETGN